MRFPASATSDTIRVDDRLGNGARPRGIAERELVVLLGAMNATAALGIDMALPAFTEIRVGLGLAPDSPRIALIVTLYFLGLAGAQMLYGPFTDRFGRNHSHMHARPVRPHRQRHHDPTAERNLTPRRSRRAR